MNSNELPWTGERLVPSIKNFGAIEHLHRYAFATEFVKDKIVADVACGEGYGSNILSQKAKLVTGIDISNEVIDHANKKYGNSRLKFVEGSADRLPVESSSIEVLVSFETIEHITTQREMLSEAKRVLKKDGIMIISSPEKSNYQDKLIEKNHFHVKELYFSEFEELINSYFKHSVFLKQKFLSGSLIIPSEGSGNFTTYKGDYSDISKFQTIDEQTFNISIASDEMISFNGSSFFELGNFEDISNSATYEDQYKRILNSRTYKLGRIITSPIRMFKRIIR